MTDSKGSLHFSSFCLPPPVQTEVFFKGCQVMKNNKNLLKSIIKGPKKGSHFQSELEMRPLYGLSPVFCRGKNNEPFPYQIIQSYQQIMKLHFLMRCQCSSVLNPEVKEGLTYHHLYILAMPLCTIRGYGHSHSSCNV